MSNSRNRVNEDELQWDDDLSILGGVPYTGEAFLNYPNGAREREVYYVNGFREGVCRDWHPNGHLKLDWFAERGRVKGQMTEWYDNGVVKSIGIYEFGVELRYVEWDSLGTLVASRELDPNSEIMRYVELMRASNA